MAGFQTPVKFDSTLGALFLGNVFAAIFYGVTCIQTYVYYGKNYKDYLAIKILIYFLWFLDSLQLALITHASYHYLVSNFGEISIGIWSPIWRVFESTGKYVLRIKHISTGLYFHVFRRQAQIYVTSMSDFLIRGFFGRQVWLISGRNIILGTCIAATTSLSLVCGFVYISMAFTLGSLAHFAKISYLLYIGLGNAAVADILIAVSLCIALSPGRREAGPRLKSSISVTNELMMYSINTCLLTTIISIVVLITYATLPGTLIFVGLLYSHCKLHFNSLLATLNNREALRERLGGVVISDLTRNGVNPVSDLRFKHMVQLDISGAEVSVGLQRGK